METVVENVVENDVVAETPVLETLATEPEAAAPVVKAKKKNEVTGARRETMLAKVLDLFENQVKPLHHSGVFKALFPDEPESKEAITKWRDIGTCLTQLANGGSLTTFKLEGKNRTVFAKVGSTDETPALEDATPAPENTESTEA